MKKYLKIILSILGVLIVIILGNILINKFYKTKYDYLDETDKEMLQELSLLYKTFKENSNDLWNEEYKLNEKPLIIIRTNKDKGIIKKYAYSVNIKGINDNLFSRKMDIPSSLELPDIYRLSGADIKVLSAGFLDNYGTIKINDEKIFYYKYHPKMMEDPELYYDFSSFLLHESFHTYKQEHWTYDKNDGEYIPDYPTNEENYALMGLEFKLLDTCMDSDDLDTVKKTLKDWTLVRSYRYEKWPQLIGETKSEAIEGTARYIEYKYNDLVGRTLTVLAKKEEPYRVTFMEAYEFIANDQAESPEYLQRTMRYETGAALGLIMDELNISWKDKIEDNSDNKGKTQYEILRNYFNIDKEHITEEQILKIKGINDYNKLLEDGRRIVELVNEK